MVPGSIGPWDLQWREAKAARRADLSGRGPGRRRWRRVGGSV